MLIPGKALINFNKKIFYRFIESSLFPFNYNLRSKSTFFILGLNIINSVLLAFSAILLALSQFDKFFKLKLTNLIF